MKMAGRKLNPTDFWGLEARGFAFDNLAILNPETGDKPFLGVIDSGTTLILVPTRIYMNLLHEMASKFKDDPTVDFVCARTKETGLLDHCYFNNTKCDDFVKNHGDKIGNLKFMLGDYVFELTPATQFRDGKNVVERTDNKVDCCTHLIRKKDDLSDPKSSEFLIGNVFLKNFYSIYDYDQ